jgi:hypothetical protein
VLTGTGGRGTVKLMQPPSMAARPMMIVIFRIAAQLRILRDTGPRDFRQGLKLLWLLGGIKVDNVRLSAQDRSSAMRIDAGPDRFAVLAPMRGLPQHPR